MIDKDTHILEPIWVPDDNPEWNAFGTEYRIKPPSDFYEIHIKDKGYVLRFHKYEMDYAEFMDAVEGMQKAIDTKPKEPKYLYLFKDQLGYLAGYANKGYELENVKYVGKIKLENGDE